MSYCWSRHFNIYACDRVRLHFSFAEKSPPLCVFHNPESRAMDSSKFLRQIELEIQLWKSLETRGLNVLNSISGNLAQIEVLFFLFLFYSAR